MKNINILIIIVILLFASTIQTASSTNETQNIDSELKTKMMGIQGNSKNTIPIIVLLNSKSITTNNIESKQQSLKSIKNNANKAQNDFLLSDEFKQSKTDIENVNQLWIVNAIAMDATPQAIETISKNKNVQIITSVKTIHLLESTPPQVVLDDTYIQSSVPWGISKIRAPDVWNLNVTGSGINISIIDSGINTSHSDLNDLDDNISTTDPKVIEWIDYINSIGTPYDDNGHGTHVAGTASGTGGIGVAPSANLFAAKIFDSAGAGSGLDLYYAFQWSIENGADIISYSGAGSHDPIFTSMINNTIAAGVIPVIAAGNEGPSTNTITCPGDEKNSLTVGATDSSDIVASFSSRGPVTLDGETYIKPDVSAPGVSIISSYHNGGYAIMDGTSMATPHVSGAAALMLQVNPNLSPSEIKSMLESTSLDIDVPGKDNNTGAGRIDAYNAIMAVDIIPPLFSNEKPTNTSFINNQTPLVSINITDNVAGINISSIVMKVNGSDVNEAITPIANGFHVENLTTQSFADGQFVNISITASDNASNSLTYNWSFTIDTTPPVINITHPTEWQVIQTSTTNLNITTDETTAIWYRIGNEENRSKVNETTTLNTTLPQLNDSLYNITVFAKDLAGNLNSTMVNFTIFATPPVISTPVSGEIFYITQNTTYVNGTTTIGTNVSVYVNDALVNESYPVAQGMFNVSGVPLVNGTNVINVTAIYNYTAQDYFSTNTSLTVSVGQIIDIGSADNIIINVPALAQGIALPFIDFNITGQGNNIPDNISASIVAAASMPTASNLTGPAIDFSVPGYESYTFDRAISITLGFNRSSVVDFNKTVVAWYNESNGAWVSLKSTVNQTANTTTANVTHFTIFAPIEDNTPPANITNLTSTGQTTSSIALSWINTSDTDYVEIWRGDTHITNVSTASYTNSGLSSSTSYIYALRPVDIVENKGNWTNITVSTSTPASPPSSSSGGGGGGGTSGEEFENIEFKDVSRVYISANTDASFIFSEAENDIQSINYKALTSAGYISATVEVLKDTSALVEQAPSGKVYKNMNIWLGKAGYATEHNIENPVIGFKVQRSWIQDKRIDESSIKLNRYSDDAWTALPTTKTDEDATYLYFESQTPGFSPFAIAAQEKTISSPVSIKDEPAADSLSPVEETSVETTTTPEIKTVEKTSIWGNLLIGALILIIIAGAYMYKWKQQD